MIIGLAPVPFQDRSNDHWSDSGTLVLTDQNRSNDHWTDSGTLVLTDQSRSNDHSRSDNARALRENDTTNGIMRRHVTACRCMSSHVGDCSRLSWRVTSRHPHSTSDPQATRRHPYT